MTIESIFQRLANQCDESIRSINTVNDAHYLSTDELKTIRDLVVKQAFVSVFTEWEHFLEDMTIAYALGKENSAGYCPQRYVLPQDEEHADQLIKSSTTYFDWSKIDDVVKLENSFFHNGEPFVAAIQGFRSKYNDMKKVRNVIVHNSIKSRDQFDTLVRNALRASAVGISPVEFLLSKKNSNPFFYSIYITHIKNAATIIANYSPAPQVEPESNPN